MVLFFVYTTINPVNLGILVLILLTAVSCRVSEKKNTSKQQSSSHGSQNILEMPITENVTLQNNLV